MLSYQDEEHDIELRRKLCNERTTYISSLFGLKVKIYSNDLQIHCVILTTKSINVRHDGVCICGAIFRLVPSEMNLMKTGFTYEQNEGTCVSIIATILSV